MADEDAPHANGNGLEENGHVPEIELIIKVSLRLIFTNIVSHLKVESSYYVTYSITKSNTAGVLLCCKF